LAFYHRQVREAITRRYLWSAQQSQLHGLLAEVFRKRADPRKDGSWTDADPRAISELPYHLAAGSDRSGFLERLTDFNFLAAKVGLLGVDKLARDFELPRSLPPGEDLVPLETVMVRSRSHDTLL